MYFVEAQKQAKKDVKFCDLINHTVATWQLILGKKFLLLEKNSEEKFLKCTNLIRFSTKTISKLVTVQLSIFPA